MTPKADFPLDLVPVSPAPVAALLRCQPSAAALRGSQRIGLVTGGNVDGTALEEAADPSGEVSVPCAGAAVDESDIDKSLANDLFASIDSKVSGDVGSMARAHRASSAPKADESKRLRHVFVTSPPGVGKTTLVQRLLTMLRNEEGDGGVEVVGFYTEEMRDEKGNRCGFDVVRVGAGPPGSAPRCALARLGQEPPRVGKYSIDVTSFEAFALPSLLARQVDPALPENPRLYSPPEGPPEAVGLLEELPGSGGQEGEEEPGAGAACRIFVPSLGEEIEVDAALLGELPEGWRPQGTASQEGAGGAEPEACPCLCVCDEVGKMELLSQRFPEAFLGALDSGATILGTLPQPAKGQRDHELVERVRRRPDTRVLRLTRNNRDALVPQAYATLREGLGLGPPGVGSARLSERRAKEKAEREALEAREREERERAEARERERVAKRERQAARERERAAQAKVLAQKRELLARAAREKRKARAMVRKRAQEAAESGVVMAVEDAAGDSDSLEVEGDGAVEDLDGVEDLDATVDVEGGALAQRPRRAPAAAPPLPPTRASRPPPPRPVAQAPRAANAKAAGARGRSGVVLFDEVL